MLDLFCALSYCGVLYNINLTQWPRSKTKVCGHSPAEIMGSNPSGVMDVWFVLSIVCCQVEISATS